MADQGKPQPPDPIASDALAAVPVAPATIGGLFGRIDVVGLESQRVYLMREEDVKALASSSEQETLWLAFFCSTGSGFVGAFATLLTAGQVSLIAVAVFAGLLSVLALSSIVFGALWWRARGKRKELRTTLENRGATAYGAVTTLARSLDEGTPEGEGTGQ